MSNQWQKLDIVMGRAHTMGNVDIQQGEKIAEIKMHPECSLPFLARAMQNGLAGVPAVVEEFLDTPEQQAAARNTRTVATAAANAAEDAAAKIASDTDKAKAAAGAGLGNPNVPA